MTATVEFAMPSLGADMDAGTVLEWRIGPGDAVTRGDIVAVVETDKADIDIEVWRSGVVSEILVQPGIEVPVGTPLALLEVDDATMAGRPTPSQPQEAATVDAAPAERRPQSPETDAPRPEPAGVGAGSPAPGTGRRPSPSRVAASPLARRLAAERGIALEAVTGSGPGGAVISRDLETATDRPHPATTSSRGSEAGAMPAAEPARSPSERMRAAIAETMARSKRDIPHYYLATDIDLDAATRWLATLNADRAVEDRILPSALLLKAVAVASAEHRQFNGHWIGDRFRAGDGVHLGVAVSLRGGGLVAPAIHDADRLSLPELMAALRDLVGRARAGRLRGSEMTDATLTVSNLGDRGVALVAGVIYPPQVALVGLGRIQTRPVVVDGEVVARAQVTATLSADHRATDGQLGARYLNTIDRLLQKPDQL